MSGTRATIAILASVVIGGCSLEGNSSQSLTPQAFYDQQPGAGPDARRQAVDSGGAIVRNPPPIEERSSQMAPPPQPTPTRIAPSVAAAASAATAEAPPVPITLGSTTAPSGTTAQYLTAGGVVVTVSGKPIYADKVVRALTPLLSNAAKELDSRAFRIKAQNEIAKQVGAMIQDELFYATAIQGLTSQDKQIVSAATAQWRKTQVTLAGGSEEQARARARAEGMDFDEKVNDQNRVLTWQVYLQKKILPLVQVRADDMREYYHDHQDEFTEHEQVQFRVIKITAEASGGRDRAIDKIGAVRQKLLNATDEEFGKEASDVNDDRALKQSAGRLGSSDGWLRRDSFAVKEVEDAVWALQPGQLTQAIEVNNSFYLARLEARKPGRTRSFNDQAVQTEIREKLRRPQIESRQRQLTQRLMREAVISPAEPDLEPVVEMAVQKYPEWRAAK